MASVLSGSRSARLDRRLVYDKGLATNVSSAVFESELSSLLLVIATVKPGVEPAAVEQEIDAVLGDLLATGPTADELQRARSRRLADFVRGIERLGGFGGRSDVLAESLTFDGKADAYLDQLETLATATPAQVQAAAREWLQTFHYTMTVRPYPTVTPGRRPAPIARCCRRWATRPRCSSRRCSGRRCPTDSRSCCSSGMRRRSSTSPSPSTPGTLPIRRARRGSRR